MILAGGASNTTYLNGERGFICQPAAQNLFLVLGGWGALYPTPCQGTQTPCQRSAVPSQARNGAPQPMAATLQPFDKPTRPPSHAVAVRCDAQRKLPDTASACAPDLAPRFGPKKNVTPATVGHCEQVIYKCPRERGPIYAQRNGSRGAATAGTGRGNWMGGGSAMRMACRRAGDWCRGWPRAIGAGAVGHGTRGGVAACVRKS